MAKRLHSLMSDDSCNDTPQPASKRMRIREKLSVDKDPAAGFWDDIDFEDKDDISHKTILIH